MLRWHFLKMEEVHAIVDSRRIIKWGYWIMVEQIYCWNVVKTKVLIKIRWCDNFKFSEELNGVEGVITCSTVHNNIGFVEQKDENGDKLFNQMCVDPKVVKKLEEVIFVFSFIHFNRRLKSFIIKYTLKEGVNGIWILRLRGFVV